MEFQADLVAVSATGSDALIYALYKLNAADDAWSRVVSFAENEANSGRRVGDLFSLQSRDIELMRRILNDSAYGVVPENADPSGFRVFKTALVAPPNND